MRLFHDNSEGLIAIPRWRTERLGQGSFASKSGKTRSEHIPSGLPPRADIVDALRHFRFVPGSDICTAANPRRYSITSLAGASTDGGRVRPSALAALRLIASSYLVGACTGRSAGFSPLRMRST